MTLKNVVLNGDSAIGHTDIQGNAVTGTVTATGKLTVSGKKVARSGDTVFFPSHPHQIVLGSPADYQTHSVPVSGSGKLVDSGGHVVLDGAIVAVADSAGPDATITASSTKLKSF